MNSSNLNSQSFSQAIQQSNIDSDATITDEDIENIDSLEIPELREFLNARIQLTKQTRNVRARKISTKRKKRSPKQ